jgi:DNA-binding transcriptional LysR family regulator
LRRPIFCLDPRRESGVRGGIFTGTLYPEELESGELVSVLNDWTQPFAGLRLYYPGHRHVPPGLRALVAMIRERGIIPG